MTHFLSIQLIDAYVFFFGSISLPPGVAFELQADKREKIAHYLRYRRYVSLSTFMTIFISAITKEGSALFQFYFSRLPEVLYRITRTSYTTSIRERPIYIQRREFTGF